MSFKISLAGDLGSGKSTVAKILADKYNAEIISAGKIQRELASKLGLTIEQFNVFMEEDNKYDNELDEMLSKYDSRAGDYILDSRMAWHFVPSAISFYLKVDKIVAATRVYQAHREDESFNDIDQTLESLMSRRASERKRYIEYYGKDILDESNYDLVIDTTTLSPVEVAKVISDFYERKIKG